MTDERRKTKDERDWEAIRPSSLILGPVLKVEAVEALPVDLEQRLQIVPLLAGGAVSPPVPACFGNQCILDTGDPDLAQRWPSTVNW